MSKKFKRKHYFVDKKFQTKFIVNVLIIVLLIVILLSIFLVLVTSNEMGQSAYSKLLELKNTRQVILPVVVKVSMLVLFVGVIIVVVRFLLVSHRIAGPMIRFKRELKNLKNGDLTLNIRFRDGDEMQELAFLLTDAVKSMNNKVSDISKKINLLKKIVNNKNKLNNSELSHLTKIIKGLTDDIKWFKLR